MLSVGLGPRNSRIDIDPARLTPRARALAEVWASAPLGFRRHILLESARTLREMGATEDDALWYGDDALGQSHRITWSSWSDYPQGSTMDPHDYLEQQAARMPIGYYPVGLGRDDRVPSADDARDDTDLITKPQVMEVLRELGRPISAAVLDNYRSRPPAGWPQPVEYVGRTPRWSLAAIKVYATHAPPNRSV